MLRWALIFLIIALVAALLDSQVLLLPLQGLPNCCSSCFWWFA